MVLWFTLSLLAGWLAGQIGAHWLRSHAAVSLPNETSQAASDWASVSGSGPRVQPYVARQALSVPRVAA